MSRLRAASSRIHPESLLPSREHAWLRVALIGGPLIAFMGAVVSVALAPAIGPGLVLAGVLLPAVIVGLLGAALWRRPYLFAAALMINVEAIVAGAVLPDGIAVAVGAPMISVALVQGSLDSRQLRAGVDRGRGRRGRRRGAGRARRARQRPVHGHGDGRDDRRRSPPWSRSPSPWAGEPRPACARPSTRPPPRSPRGTPPRRSSSAPARCCPRSSTRRRWRPRRSRSTGRSRSGTRRPSASSAGPPRS